jgi:hypothetical protein
MIHFHFVDADDLLLGVGERASWVCEVYKHKHGVLVNQRLFSRGVDIQNNFTAKNCKTMALLYTRRETTAALVDLSIQAKKENYIP